MFAPLYAILGLAVLMVVHEAGHFFVAKAFGMRVERFAIGIGPTIWKYKPKNSPTTYQVGLIPFLAYVQIAGLNPWEDIDPDDKQSYANASLFGRISAIIAGPLANYVFASVVFLGAALIRGEASTEVTVEAQLEIVENKETKKIESPAYAAGMRTGDRIVNISGRAVTEWEQVPELITPHPGEALPVIVLRDGKDVKLSVVPGDRGGKGFIGVQAGTQPLPLSKAILPAVETPAVIVAISLEGLGRMFSGKESPQFSGPLGLMRETSRAVEEGMGQYFFILGVLSTSLAFFNMLPIPALDGGRLMFLAYEAVTRRRANQKVEAQIHLVGMLMLLTTLALVTYKESRTDKSPSELAEEQHQKELQEKAEKAKPAAETQPARSDKNSAESAAQEPK